MGLSSCNIDQWIEEDRQNEIQKTINGREGLLKIIAIYEIALERIERSTTNTASIKGIARAALMEARKVPQ